MTRQQRVRRMMQYREVYLGNGHNIHETTSVFMLTNAGMVAFTSHDKVANAEDLQAAALKAIKELEETV
jgi:hypothetical protein